MPWDKLIALGLRPGRINKIKMNQEIQDALNAACPKTTMSPTEIVNAYIDQCCGNSFAEAEKFFRKMGDNSGIASVDHYEKF